MYTGRNTQKDQQKAYHPERTTKTLPTKRATKMLFRKNGSNKTVKTEVRKGDTVASYRILAFTFRILAFFLRQRCTCIFYEEESTVWRIRSS